jgi:hypothetical protein
MGLPGAGVAITGLTPTDTWFHANELEKIGVGEHPAFLLAFAVRAASLLVALHGIEFVRPRHGHIDAMAADFDQFDFFA